MGMSTGTANLENKLCGYPVIANLLRMGSKEITEPLVTLVLRGTANGEVHLLSERL
jgi:hypothetical protein